MEKYPQHIHEKIENTILRALLHKPVSSSTSSSHPVGLQGQLSRQAIQKLTFGILDLYHAICRKLLARPLLEQKYQAFGSVSPMDFYTFRTSMYIQHLVIHI